MAWKPVSRGGREHRHHVQAQAEPRHPANRVRVLMGTLKHGVVVELSVGRQAEFTPMCHQSGPTLRRKVFRRWCHLAIQSIENELVIP